MLFVCRIMVEQNRSLILFCPDWRHDAILLSRRGSTPSNSPAVSELCVDALVMALQRRQPDPGLLHHSDRGVQPGFKGSSQRLPASIVAPRQRLRRAFSSQGSFAVWH